LFPKFAPLHALDYLIEGGAGQIPGLLASKLLKPVRLGDPVAAIQQSNSTAIVRTTNGKVFVAKSVVVAVPPYVSGLITYDPPLSWKRNQLNQHTPMGTSAKIILQYPTRFWKKQGLRGFLGVDGMVSFCADSTDHRSRKGVLACFAVGQQYDQFAAHKTNTTRKAAFLNELATYLGNDALTPVFFEVVDWPSFPYIQGGYGGYWVPQAWTRFGSAAVEPH